MIVDCCSLMCLARGPFAFFTSRDNIGCHSVHVEWIGDCAVIVDWPNAFSVPRSTTDGEFVPVISPLGCGFMWRSDLSPRYARAVVV